MVAFFALFSQFGAMVLLISPERVKLESCACTQIEALEEGKGWLYLDDAGDPLEIRRNAANLICDGGGLICPFFLNLGPWFCLYLLNKSS